MSIKGMINKLAGNEVVVKSLENLANKRPLTSNEAAVLEKAAEKASKASE